MTGVGRDHGFGVGVEGWEGRARSHLEEAPVPTLATVDVLTTGRAENGEIEVVGGSSGRMTVFGTRCRLNEPQPRTDCVWCRAHAILHRRRDLQAQAAGKVLRHASVIGEGDQPLAVVRRPLFMSPIEAQ